MFLAASQRRPDGNQTLLALFKKSGIFFCNLPLVFSLWERELLISIYPLSLWHVLNSYSSPWTAFNEVKGICSAHLSLFLFSSFSCSFFFLSFVLSFLSLFYFFILFLFVSYSWSARDAPFLRDPR